MEARPSEYLWTWWELNTPQRPQVHRQHSVKILFVVLRLEHKSGTATEGWSARLRWLRCGKSHRSEVHSSNRDTGHQMQLGNAGRDQGYRMDFPNGTKSSLFQHGSVVTCVQPESPMALGLPKSPYFYLFAAYTQTKYTKLSSALHYQAAQYPAGDV